MIYSTLLISVSFFPATTVEPIVCKWDVITLPHTQYKCTIGHNKRAHTPQPRRPYMQQIVPAEKLSGERQRIQEERVLEMQRRHPRREDVLEVADERVQLLCEQI